MSASTDTLRTAETLRESGVPDRQATAHARAIEEAVRDLVTRDQMRADLYRALLVQTAVIIGAIVALLGLIP